MTRKLNSAQGASEARSSTVISFSMECNGYPVGRLRDDHGVYERLQWGEIAVRDELYWSAVLKIPVRSVEKDTRIRLVAGVEIHERHPNPIEPTQFALQAAGIGRLPDAWGLAPDGLRNHGARNIQFTRNPSRVQPAHVGIEPCRLHCRIGSVHGTPLTHHRVSLELRQGYFIVAPRAGTQ